MPALRKGENQRSKIFYIRNPVNFTYQILMKKFFILFVSWCSLSSLMSMAQSDVLDRGFEVNAVEEHYASSFNLMQ